MPSNRVDQVTYAGGMQNHERRIRILEATPQSGGACSTLPPWFDWTADFTLTLAPASGNTDPTVTANSAWIMVQTDDGTEYDLGGTPTQLGTVLGDFKCTLTSIGSSGATTNGSLIVALTSAPAFYFPFDESPDILSTPVGFGFILDNSENAYYRVLIIGDGSILVPNIPDPSPPPVIGTYTSQNKARIDSHSGTYPAWPFAWAAGDVIAASFLYPMATNVL